MLKARGTKKSWVAEQMGVRPSAVTYWLQAGVPLDRVKPLAKLLKVRQKDLWP